MLPKPFRLRHDKDLKTLFSKGKSVFGSVVGLKYRKNDLGDSRFAVVVGTKVSKSAVKRNRLRRQVREMIHERLDVIAPGYDVAVLIRPEALGKDYDELEKHLLFVLKKTPLL